MTVPPAGSRNASLRCSSTAPSLSRNSKSHPRVSANDSCLDTVACTCTLRSAQNGWTPLIVAAHHGKLGAVRLLLDRGANMEVKENVGLVATSVVIRAASAPVSCRRWLREFIDESAAGAVGGCGIHL